MKGFLYRNGLSLVFLLLFLLSLLGQFFTGYSQYNQELQDQHAAPIHMGNYLSTGHFISATFENWESEFLQMALFVVLTRTLRQKGSSESKKLLGEKEDVDREPSKRRRNAPWPVHRGGFILHLYKHSLSIVLFLLYILSFALHVYGSMKDYNAEQLRLGNPTETLSDFILSSKVWFESFQNWQSEFLSIVAIVILSIYLRQQGSPQSKPVDAPYFQTGE